MPGGFGVFRAQEEPLVLHRAPAMFHLSDFNIVSNRAQQQGPARPEAVPARGSSSSLPSIPRLGKAGNGETSGPNPPVLHSQRSLSKDTNMGPAELH